MKKQQMAILAFLLLQLPAVGQSFTLNQCVEYAMRNNSSIKIAQCDQGIANDKINEQIGAALPQITCSGSLDDNLKVATQLMPGALFGKPGTMVPLQMGSQYAISTGIQVEQKLYDPLFFAGLQTVTISKNQASITLKKTKEQTVYSVSRSYYQTLIIKKQYEVLKPVVDATSQSLKSILLKYENGMVKKVDVDKIRVSYHNDESRLQQTELNYKKSLNNLKYQIGLALETDLVLADTMLVELQKVEYDIVKKQYCDNRQDYQLQKINLQLQEVDKNRIVSGFFPSLSCNAKYNYQTMPNELSLRGDWYESSSIGLRLSLPIFDGFQKYSRLSQSKYAIEKARENLKYTEQSIALDIYNNEIVYRNALDNIENEKNNLDLAIQVYKNMQLSFEQGSGSPLELLQSESALHEAQNNYFNKLFSAYVARLDLEQSKGTILSFIAQVR